MKGLIVMPVLDCLEVTLPAIRDSVAQLDGAADVLVINQGSSTETRKALDNLSVVSYIATKVNSYLQVVTHDPPLPALGATWNAALDYAWAAGYPDVLVVNNDIRMGSWIYGQLREACQRFSLWFATPVNVRDQDGRWQRMVALPADTGGLGGPDFSCFLITRGCHGKYRFDERFVPCWFEDNDLHRRMWLGGDGGRIAGLPLPYLHYGSMTSQRSKAVATASAKKFEQSRGQYLAKWGGVGHTERRIIPDSLEDLEGVGTPGGWLGGTYPTWWDEEYTESPGVILVGRPTTVVKWKEANHAQAE